MPFSYVRKWGEKAKKILYRHIVSVVSSITLNDIIVSEPVKDKSGQFVVILSLRNVFRESLEPNRFPEGVPDIVLHFARGWNARGAVFGEWHGQDVTSRRSREPNSFIKDAVAEFNQVANGVAVAELRGEYAQNA